jgi:hypothetical protein
MPYHREFFTEIRSAISRYAPKAADCIVMANNYFGMTDVKDNLL